MPRIGASWDFSGRGASNLYAFAGRFGQTDQALAGVQYQVLGDVVASVEYIHKTIPYDAVTIALAKPFSQDYLVQASYTWPSAVKFDAAYLYEWTPRTSASLGASFHAIEANPWNTSLDLRATYELRDILRQMATRALKMLDNEGLCPPQVIPPSGT